MHTGRTPLNVVPSKKHWKKHQGPQKEQNASVSVSMSLSLKASYRCWFFCNTQGPQHAAIQPIIGKTSVYQIVSHHVMRHSISYASVNVHVFEHRNKSSSQSLCLALPPPLSVIAAVASGWVVFSGSCCCSIGTLVCCSLASWGRCCSFSVGTSIVRCCQGSPRTSQCCWSISVHSRI